MSHSQRRFQKAAAIGAITASVLLVSGAVRGDAPSFGSPQLEWSWSILGDGVGETGLIVADLAGDGEHEVIGAHRTDAYPFGAGDHWFVLDYDGELVQTWSSLAFAERIIRLRPVDLGDGIEIGVATPTDLRLFDGQSKALLRELIAVASELRDFVIADTNADGSEELVLCDDGDVVLLDFDTLDPVATVPGLDCLGLDVGQADSDPARELLVISWSSGAVLDGGTLAVEWSDADDIGDFARFLDIDSDGVEELICAESATLSLRAIDLASGVPEWTRPLTNVAALASQLLAESGGSRILIGDSDFPPRLRALNAQTGVEVWSILIDSRTFAGLSVADLDADGFSEAIFGAEGSSFSVERLAIVDLVNQKVEYESFRYAAPLVGLSAGDVDGDGRLDLATASTSSGFSYDHGRALVLDPSTRSFAYGQTGDEGSGAIAWTSIAAALDSDSQLELCRAGWNSVYCEDGADHLEHWRLSLSSESEVSALGAADTDGDGTDELLVGAERGLLYAIDGPTGWLKWRSPETGSFGGVSQILPGELNGQTGSDILVVSRFSGGLHLVLLESSTGLISGGPWDLWGARCVGVGRLDGDSTLDILVGDESGNVSLFDLQSGTLGPPLASFGESVHGVAAADVDGDAIVDLIVRSGNKLQIFDGDFQGVVWMSPYLGPEAIPTPLFVGNADLDLDWEIVVLSWSSLEVFEFPFPGLFADGFESGDTASWSASTPLESR